MEIISSRKNKIITHMRRLGTERAYRRECGEYICDGIKLLREAVKWGAEVRTALWAETPDSAFTDIPEQYSVSRELLDYASPLKSCQGVLFSVKMKAWPVTTPGKTLVLETIQDPGNVGTILRTANALRMDTVILTGSCADIWNPKTVRAGMGAQFRQRVYEMEPERLKAYLMENGCRLYGAALSEKSADIRELTLSNAAVAIGSEGQGLSKTLLDMCDGELIIPMNAACESLNAAVAASIVMWELVRQEA